jgi:hypothetical protein
VASRFLKSQGKTAWNAMVGDAGMVDVVMIASTVGFFADCLAYMAGCERLRDGEQQ